MKLYHRTCIENISKIKNSGYLDNRSVNKTEDTILIDKALKNILGQDIRANAIYFDLSEHIPDNKNAISVDTKNLDTSKLFVGNYDIINELLEDIFCYIDEDFDNEDIAIQNCITSAKSYEESFVPFEVYKNSDEKEFLCSSLEFLYFDTIDIKYLEIHEK